jgi:acyl-coenzyme A thioesterase PaaI-like protein
MSGALPPYALSLGMTVDRLENGVPLIALEFDSKVEGRPGFLHGGAIGGLLEMAAIAALRAELLGRDPQPQIKPVNVTVEYLRGGTRQRTFALGKVTRAGRRIANLSAEAWQDDPAKPIATAWMNVLLA